MMGSLFAMSVAALLVVGAQFWYIIVRLFIQQSLHSGLVILSLPLQWFLTNRATMIDEERGLLQWWSRLLGV